MDLQNNALKKHFSSYMVLFLIAGVVIIVDQLTKSVVRHNLAIGEVYLPEWWFSQYARIVHVTNTGAANGIFQNMGRFLTLFPLVVSVVILFAFPRIPARDWLVRLALGLYLGGALGNLIDRLQQGFVTDFISVGAFPVFNVADSCVSMGVVALILGVYLHDKAKKDSPASSDETIDPQITAES